MTEAQAALDAAVDEDLIARLHAEAEARLGGIREEIERINDQIRTSDAMLVSTCQICPTRPRRSTGEASLPSSRATCRGRSRPVG